MVHPTHTVVPGGITFPGVWQTTGFHNTRLLTDTLNLAATDLHDVVYIGLYVLEPDVACSIGELWLDGNMVFIMHF